MGEWALRKASSGAGASESAAPVPSRNVLLETIVEIVGVALNTRDALIDATTKL